MRFSFDETARSEIGVFFREALEEAGKETTDLFEGLTAVYTEHQYKRLYEMTTGIAEYYSGEFRNTVQRQFEDWVNSQTSLTAFSLELEASGDAEDESYLAAEYLQEDLKEILDELFKETGPKLEPLISEAHLTKHIGEIFAEIDELLQKFESAMEDMISDYKEKVESNSEENQIYLNVGEILNAVLESFKSLFIVFRDGVSNLAAHINDRSSSAESKSNEDTVQMTAAAQTVGEALREISDLFDFD